MTINQQYYYGSYVSQLPEKMKLIIQREVFLSLKNNGFDSLSIHNEVEVAMSSKLCDLETLIDLKKILKKFK